MDLDDILMGLKKNYDWTITQRINKVLTYRQTRGGMIVGPRDKTGNLHDALSDWYATTRSRLSGRDQETDLIASITGLDHLEVAFKEKEHGFDRWQDRALKDMDRWGVSYAEVGSGTFSEEKLVRAYREAIEIVDRYSMNDYGIKQPAWLGLLS